MTSLAAELRGEIDAALRWLRAIPEETTGRPPRPGGWSARQIIGHLIDSASNNHQRFVRAQLQPSLVFPGYDQDAWVERSGYQEQRWEDLLDRWRAFNEQVAVVVERISQAELRRARAEHNLHQIAWRTVPADQPATLEYFIADYIGHLRHHLGQIRAMTSR